MKNESVAANEVVVVLAITKQKKVVFLLFVKNGVGKTSWCPEKPFSTFWFFGLFVYFLFVSTFCLPDLFVCLLCYVMFCFVFVFGVWYFYSAYSCKIKKNIIK